MTGRLDVSFLFKGGRSVFDHELEEFTIVHGSFITRSIEHVSLVINLSGHDPARMTTDSILDIKPHFGYFWGVVPVLLLVSSLLSAAYSMKNNLLFGAPHCLALFLRVGRVVLDGADLNIVIEMDFALALGTTKALGRRSIDCTDATPLRDEICRTGEHFQTMEETSAKNTVGLFGIRGDGSGVLVSHCLNVIVSLLRWIVRFSNKRRSTGLCGPEHDG